MSDVTQEVTLMSAAINLLPIVVGGIIGIAGGVSSAAYSHRLTKSESRSVELRRKLEATLSAAYDLELWLTKEQNYYLFNGPENLEHSPVGRIKALVDLHFPRLKVSALKLSLAILTYQKWMNEGKQRALADLTKRVPQDHMDKLSTVYEPYITNLAEFATEARAEMERLTTT